MNKPLVSDALWAIIAPLLPPVPPKPKGGRPRHISGRAALTGILFVLKSGIPWEMLPQEMGCGSGMTCWRRLRDWQDAGV
jgi:transposase